MFEDITTSEVWCGGVTAAPNGDWMAQVARNQTDAFDGRLNKMKCLIHDSRASVWGVQSGRKTAGWDFTGAFWRF